MDVFNDIDDALGVFEKLFNDVWDIHAPMKTSRRRHKAAPFAWFDYIFMQIKGYFITILIIIIIIILVVVINTYYCYYFYYYYFYYY